MVCCFRTVHPVCTAMRANDIACILLVYMVTNGTKNVTL